MHSIQAHPRPLQGQTTLPGDKSISHRAVMAALLLAGPNTKPYTVANLAPNADVAATLGCLKALGGDFAWQTSNLIDITPPKVLQTPSNPLDCKNSGTTLRLLTGLLAGKGIPATLTGDTSLQRRPMGRILTPLTQMGAHITATPNTNWQGKPCQTAPLTLYPTLLHGLTYTLPMASAQVKSALLLAGLGANHTPTTVIEPIPSRNHTERLLSYLGASLTTIATPMGPSGSLSHTLTPLTKPLSLPDGELWKIPGDISSAAFLMVAVLLVPGSELTLQHIGINSTRTGIIDVLQQWGITIDFHNETQWQGEPVADIHLKHQPLQGDLVIEGAMIPRLIDELPILAVAALGSHGTLTVRNAEELRHKESDRIALLTKMFEALGHTITVTEDGFSITGLGVENLPHLSPQTAQPLPTAHDHRIAMAIRVLNHACQAETLWPMEAPECMAVSFPGFDSLFTQLTR